ncbi:MAG: hypothetical protein AAGC56_08125 [Pseudomonadota bacterium]
MADTPPSIFIIAALIGAVGVWWFRLILKKQLSSLGATPRAAVYAVVFAAYFALVVILAGAPR